MESSDRKALKVVKNNSSFDDCLSSGTKSGADSDQRCDSRVSAISGSPFDETAEWAEIANIMASFGSGIGRDSTLLTSEPDNSYNSYLSKGLLSFSVKDIEVCYQGVDQWEPQASGNVFEHEK